VIFGVLEIVAQGGNCEGREGRVAWRSVLCEDPSIELCVCVPLSLSLACFAAIVFTSLSEFLYAHACVIFLPRVRIFLCVLVCSCSFAARASFRVVSYIFFVELLLRDVRLLCCAE
jgi:hypothetical protein